MSSENARKTNLPPTWSGTSTSPIMPISGGTDLHQRALATVHHSWATAAIGVLFVSIITCLDSANLIDVYGSIRVWTVAAIPSAALGALIALAGVNPALRLWWQIVFLAFAQFIVGPVFTLNATTIAHIMPTLTTLSQGFTQTFGAFKYVIAVSPPIGSANGSLMALWTLNLFTAFLAGVFAVSTNSKINLITVFPLALNLVASALLGTSHGVARQACGIVAMLALAVWLAWRWQSFDIRRPVSIVVILVITIALAFGATFVAPQHRLILRDHYNPPLDPHQYTSPLSGMRSYVKYHKKETLLTVSGLPAGTPVRLAVMDRFDGNVWNFSDSSDADDSSDYRKIGENIASGSNNGNNSANTNGDRFKATFKVGKGFSEQWLPLAGTASSIRLDGRNLYYNTGTHSAIVTGSDASGIIYTEFGTIANPPTEQQIARSHAQRIGQPEARDVPDNASKFATALTGRQSSDGTTAQSLATALKTKGWFSHGLAGDYPSLPGHGNFRIDSMLGEGAMVGDSEQYASLMAMMARKLNLPSRVVLGFVPKDKDGNISKSRTTRDATGISEMTFTGNDIEAWVEINFKDYGWVPFHPTPKETKTPDKNQNLSLPKPKTLVHQPPVPLVDPLHDQAQARDQSSLGGTDAGNENSNAVLMKIIEISKKVAICGSPLWIFLIICTLILVIKAIQLAVMARRGTPEQRIASGWTAIDMLAKQSGIAVQGTRRHRLKQIETALESEEQTMTAGKSTIRKPVDLPELKLLSREADWVIFSGRKPEDDTSQDYWQRVKSMRKSMLAAQPHLRRLRTRLSLKGVLRMPHPHLKKSRRSASTTAGGNIEETLATNTTKRTYILADVHSAKRKPAGRKGQ
ncbi:transglutaminase-like domain-containing protein [Bifidobacterium sp. ESL0745]|uniref:transglutaminase-like domain-containing protein n=1 Tax=Bifidobacterium sp. ESL0745 TaxID=2983226 RepID=UPI0023F6FDB0|nr:transglutaminase-like domain-containing protein [Bifidobacterium sp. ESL0745]MDF7665542.1 transglutaminase-like domain-containing protein [Bifidobacterium sp. ESL0745]